MLNSRSSDKILRTPSINEIVRSCLGQMGLIVLLLIVNVFLLAIVFGPEGTRQNDISPRYNYPWDPADAWKVWIFIAIFGTINLLIFFAFLKRISMLANPSIELRLQQTMLRAGKSMDLSWHIQPRLTRLNSIVISLEGEQRISDTGQDKNRKARVAKKNYLADITLINITDRAIIEAGHATVTLPADMTPSGRQRDLQTTWQLKLEGKIPFWPNVEMIREVVVLR